MKIYEGYKFIKAIQEDKIKSDTKFKAINKDKGLNAIVRFDGVDIVYYDNNRNIFSDYFLTTIINSTFTEIEKEKEKIEEKLDWEEIIGSVGKPVWDNKRKKWRVLDYYSREKNKFSVSFSDTSDAENFEKEELYFKEIKESGEK